MEKARPATPAPPRRPRELEDALNFHLYHPLAWVLARALAHTPVTPNMVSVAGGCCVVAAGVTYSSPAIVGVGWPLPALVGMALHMGWHVVDGADGDLARLTNRASPYGEMIDGICDYASHTILYVILAFMLASQIGWLAWPVMATAAVSHIFQATHVETQRRSYQWWVYGVPWLRQTRAGAAKATRQGAGGALISAYMAVGGALTAHVPPIDAAFAQADPARREVLRGRARTECGALLPLLHWLGPNPRAVVLGLSMLIGRTPLWFFVWQVVVLNALLVVSVRRHARAAQKILEACQV